VSAIKAKTGALKMREWKFKGRVEHFKRNDDKIELLGKAGA